MIKLKNKKAQERAYLLGVIVIIVSFVIILTVLLRLNPGQIVLQQSCTTSVVARGLASSEILKTQVREAIPLKCNITKICFSAGGDCKDLGTNYQKISVKTKEDILNAIAQNMYDWHKTLNEGKSNFMPQEKGITGQSRFCMINSILSLDDSAKKLMLSTGVTHLDLERVLEKKTDKDGKSYFTILRNGYSNIEQELSLAATENKDTLENFLGSDIDFSQKQIVYTSLYEEKEGLGITGGIVGSLVAIAVVIAAAPVVATAATVTVIVSGIAMTATAAASGIGTYYAVDYFVRPSPDANYQYAAPSIIVYNKEALDSLKCSGFEGLI